MATIAFEYEGLDHQACTNELLATIAAFAGQRFTPRGVSFEITCLDPAMPLVEIGAPPRPFWFLRGPAFHDARISDDDVVSIVEDLVPTHDVVTAIVEEALAQPADGLTSLTQLPTGSSW